MTETTEEKTRWNITYPVVKAREHLSSLTEFRHFKDYINERQGHSQSPAPAGDFLYAVSELICSLKIEIQELKKHKRLALDRVKEARDNATTFRNEAFNYKDEVSSLTKKRDELNLDIKKRMEVADIICKENRDLKSQLSNREKEIEEYKKAFTSIASQTELKVIEPHEFCENCEPWADSAIYALVGIKHLALASLNKSKEGGGRIDVRRNQNR